MESGPDVPQGRVGLAPPVGKEGLVRRAAMLNFTKAIKGWWRWVRRTGEERVEAES